MEPRILTVPMNPEFFPETALLLGGVIAGILALRHLFAREPGPALRVGGIAVACIVLALFLGRSGWIHSNYGRQSKPMVLLPASTPSPDEARFMSLTLGDVILRVAPRVNVNGNVLLNIEQEISNIVDNGNASTLTPTISQRKVKSSIAVASGQSVLLGGLISETQDRARSGIPLVEEIPILGEAFSRNIRTTRRTELVIFIQPQIIRDSVDAYKVAEELRTKLRGSAETSFPPGPNLRRDPLLVR